MSASVTLNTDPVADGQRVILRLQSVGPAQSADDIDQLAGQFEVQAEMLGADTVCDITVDDRRPNGHVVLSGLAVKTSAVDQIG